MGHLFLTQQFARQSAHFPIDPTNEWGKSVNWCVVARNCVIQFRSLRLLPAALAESRQRYFAMQPTTGEWTTVLPWTTVNQRQRWVAMPFNDFYLLLWSEFVALLRTHTRIKKMRCKTTKTAAWSSLAPPYSHHLRRAIAQPRWTRGMPSPDGAPEQRCLQHLEACKHFAVKVRAPVWIWRALSRWFPPNIFQCLGSEQTRCV